ncbi:MAG TPA: hypothetical protein VK589_12535 [Chryseolinea sp.]|nr:hypothetical protein [Chryseolinea sp.]
MSKRLSSTASPQRVSSRAASLFIDSCASEMEAHSYLISLHGPAKDLPNVRNCGLVIPESGFIVTRQTSLRINHYFGGACDRGYTLTPGLNPALPIYGSYGAEPADGL